jgi:hypothetical protein
MNIQRAQPIPGQNQQPDQQPLCGCHQTAHCPDHATTPINTAQLARIAELLDVLDGFLRRADGIADHLADYLHTTRGAPHRARYDANQRIDQVSFTAHALRAHRHKPLQ